MKKVLLSSVAALAVFAAAAPVFAEGELGANRWSNESGYYANTLSLHDGSSDLTVPEIKAENDKDLGVKSEKWTRDANKLKEGEVLKVEKGDVEAPKAEEKKEDAKAPAAAGQKTLPKTSAVK